MNPANESLLLRVYLDEADRLEHQPLYEVLLARAREMDLAGAVVLRGVMGYGASHRMHTAKILDLSASLPIIVEFVDRAETIESFLPVLAGLTDGGLSTVEKVSVTRYPRRGSTSG